MRCQSEAREFYDRGWPFTDCVRSLEKRHFMHEQRSSIIRKENLFSLREPRSTSMVDDARATNEHYRIAGWDRFQERSFSSCLPELNLSLGLKSTIWWLCNARPKSFLHPIPPWHFAMCTQLSNLELNVRIK